MSSQRTIRRRACASRSLSLCFFFCESHRSFNFVSVMNFAVYVTIIKISAEPFLSHFDDLICPLFDLPQDDVRIKFEFSGERR